MYSSSIQLLCTLFIYLFPQTTAIISSPEEKEKKIRKSRYTLERQSSMPALIRYFQLPLNKTLPRSIYAVSELLSSSHPRYSSIVIRPIPTPPTPFLSPSELPSSVLLPAAASLSSPPSPSHSRPERCLPKSRRSCRS